ncbi:glycoside hydrolase family 3 N-terminal domain-containing protein [Pantoea anthophila]|uniref:glycoside hydrolase family 3 N-terminal domain-containing protein n=1 Tax=Pantoea anthophila TaxID=470931 RepID=UPI002788C40E|nr:glycoside hydrolase family 3 N-terminal domain-containing protein [Pantoea anthophila]MDQ1214219.1 beta-glucosidase-like glycosyl hydrolase [Pantoea anthophila]
MDRHYQDPSLPVETRVRCLLDQMTLDEKIAQMHGYWLVISDEGKVTERQDASDRFSHRRAKGTFDEKIALGVGQITRPFGSVMMEAESGIAAFNALQKRIISSGRFGIPAMFHEECLTGVMCMGATLFPSSLNMASTWHPGLINTMAECIGREARSIGCRQALAPVLDVSRDLRWGRTEETFGEDPYLVGIMATEYVKGLQGEKRDLLATLKHYAAHSFSEGGRNHAPVHLGFKELNDIFLLPFEMAVKLADAGSVMPAYHDIDNQPCHNDHFLLTELLRQRWGFDGLIVADYGGVSLLHQHHAVTANRTESAASAFNAGLDIELPKDDCAATLKEALDSGLIEEQKINEITARILTEKFRSGLFDHPFITEIQPDFQSERARFIARQVALESITLLENDGTLPMQTETLKSVAVIGPTADDPLALLTGYSFPVHLILSDEQAGTRQVITPLSALRQALPACRISYQKGCHILTHRAAGTPVFPGDVDKVIDVLPVSQDESLIAEAVKAVRESELAICFVGDLAGLFQSGTSGEGSDTDNLNLPGVQQKLLASVVETGVPTIVVMISGRPYSLQGLEDRVAGFLMAWQPGQEGGYAIADILTGQQSPSGKLVVSVPTSVGAMPYFYNHKMKSSGTPIAFHFPPRYAFGYGLTYASFRLLALSMPETVFAIEDEVTFSVTVENRGEYEGDEVIQVYLRDIQASLVRPIKELKAFQRVRLAPAQSAEVKFRIPSDMLNFTDNQGRRRVEPGEFNLMIGNASDNIVFQRTFTLKGEVRILDEIWAMESQATVSLC